MGPFRDPTLRIGTRVATLLIYQRTAALLWDLNQDTLPTTLSAYFTKASSVHDKNTRFAISGSLKVVNKANSFQSIGTHIFNDLNYKQLFSVNSKHTFLDKIKFDFISEYWLCLFTYNTYMIICLSCLSVCMSVSSCLSDFCPCSSVYCCLSDISFFLGVVDYV